MSNYRYLTILEWMFSNRLWKAITPVYYVMAKPERVGFLETENVSNQMKIKFHL